MELTYKKQGIVLQYERKQRLRFISLSAQQTQNLTIVSHLTSPFQKYSHGIRVTFSIAKLLLCGYLSVMMRLNLRAGAAHRPEYAQVTAEFRISDHSRAQYAPTDLFFHQLKHEAKGEIWKPIQGLDLAFFACIGLFCSAPFCV